MIRDVKHSLLETHPNLAKQWSVLNDKTPSDVTFGSRYLAIWDCNKGHSWVASVQNRTGRKSGCGICNGKQVLPGFNDLASVHPHIAKYYSNNNSVPATEVPYGSGKVYLWTCELGHEFPSRITTRHTATGCSICSGRQVQAGFNDLKSRLPSLANEWHQSNSTMPDEYTLGSTYNAWWICSNGHVWQAQIKNRVRGDGCRACGYRRTSGSEKYLYEALKIHYPQAKQGEKLSYPFKTIYPDILIKLDIGKAIIEYDGEYWHRFNQDSDVLKTNLMLDSGILVFRVRESTNVRTADFLDMSHPNLIQLGYIFNRKDRSELDRIAERIAKIIGDRLVH